MRLKLDIWSNDTKAWFSGSLSFLLQPYLARLQKAVADKSPKVILRHKGRMHAHKGRDGGEPGMAVS